MITLKGGDIMYQDDFSFDTDTLYSCAIEDRICRSCGLGNSDSSGGALFMKLNEYIPVSVSADKGTLDCDVYISKIKNTETYHVEVTSVRTSGYHRR